MIIWPVSADWILYAEYWEVVKLSIAGHISTIAEYRKQFYIGLKSTRTGFPIGRMPKRSHTRTSHAVIFYRNCLGFFASGQKLIQDR